jgi:hypothetical protein
MDVVGAVPGANGGLLTLWCLHTSFSFLMLWSADEFSASFAKLLMGAKRASAVRTEQTVAIHCLRRSLRIGAMGLGLRTERLFALCFFFSFKIC